MEAVSGRRKPAEASPHALAPLRLGDGDTPVCELREVIPGPKGQATLTLEQLQGRPVLRLTKRGAASLSEWLGTWARPQAKPVFWGIDGIAQECKVSRRTVHNWAARDDFPSQVRVVGGNGPVWEAHAVKAWVRLARPRTGRPKKQKGRG